MSTSNLRATFLQELNLVASSAGADQRFVNISGAIAKGNLQVVQHSIYCSRATGGSNLVKMTDASDTKNAGINNFANSQLAESELLLVTGLRVQAVVLGATPTEATIKSANFGSIKGVDGLQNGEIDIIADGKPIVKNFPLSNFVTDNKQDSKLGFIDLEVVKWILPRTEIKIEVRTGSGTSTSANTILRVELLGAATTN